MGAAAKHQVPSRIDSSSVAAAHRVEYWREMISSSFVALDCEVPESTRFSGSLSNGALRDIQVSSVVAGAQSVSRTMARIRQNPEDFFLLSFQLRGNGRVVQSGRDALLRPGDFALYDSTRPYGLIFDADFEQIVLRLPRALMAHRLMGLDRITAVPFRSQEASASLAFDFVTKLSREFDHLAPAVQAVFHQALIDILTATLAQRLGANAPREMPSRLALRQRICSFVELHLGRADMDCRQVAEAHGISPRYLSKLFAAEGQTPSEWIWARRLERARAAIENASPSARSITQIAYDCGFKDPAHFSRAFKARFGLSPSELRKGPR
jgi:AraC-like DNA-binding protein